MSPPGIVILTGPTCAGKSALAVALAERFDAEIVGADSRQIYRGMPLGTAAPTAADRARVPHHLVDFLDPAERYSAARFAGDALTAIAQIAARGRRCLIVGGTGFYVRALAGDASLSRTYDETLRARLAREAQLHPPGVLHAWLATRDPARAAALTPSDGYRVVRALEIALAGNSGAVRPPHPSLRAGEIPYVKLGLDVPQEVLEARIATRVDRMLADGFLDEAERIGASAVAANAVGYPEALAYLSGESTAQELRASLVRATRRYAKRQRTWLRTEPNLQRIASESDAHAAALQIGWTPRRRMAPETT